VAGAQERSIAPDAASAAAREEDVPRHGSATPGAEVDLGPAPAKGKTIASWSIRRKLTLLVMIPLIALLVGGGALVTQIALEYRQAHTARIYADSTLPALQTFAALQDEFFATDPANAAEIKKARAVTDQNVAALQQALQDLREVDSRNPDLPIQVETLSNTLNELDNARGAVDRVVRAAGPQGAQSEAGVAQIQNATKPLFTSLTAILAGLTSELAKTGTTRETSDGADLVGALARAAQFAGTERTDRATVLRDPSTADKAAANQLALAVAEQTTALDRAGQAANPEQRGNLLDITNDNDQLERWREDTPAPNEVPAGTPEKLAKDAATWSAFASDRLSNVFGVTNQAAVDAREFAQDAETAALWRAGFVAAAVLVTLAIVTTLLATIARSVTLPLRRLRSGAVEVASVQLPAAVARIEQDGSAADITLPPVLPADSAVGPETIEVARAVDDLGAEAVRLATAQVRLRRALDEAFVSMSRRSQAMVEKQLAIIDELESQEQDPDQLRNLFRLDHLAARMRRYNDNLLVLAGSAVRTRATAPVKVAELFRAATSEMEQYERVRLQPVSGASISGTVAGELVHLLAELLDNAAMYSPPSSAIVLSAAFTADGGLQIEVLDAGVGISPGELDRLNARLAQPESIDTQVPSRMGLFVVARLARRGGFGVMLQSRPDASGTVAMVRVPPTLVIGAPGSTGEQPQIAGRAVPANGLPQRAPQPALSDRPHAPALDPAVADRGALAAAAAAAGVRSAVGDEDGGDSPLPRRRKPPRTSTPPGFEPAEIAAASTMTPPGGLFTPATPADAADSSEGRAIREEVRGGDYSRAAYTDYGQGLGGQSYTDQIAVPPPETSPGGLPLTGAPAAAAGTPAAGLPQREPATGPGGLPQRPRPTGTTGGISAVTTGSSSASALPSDVGLPPVVGTPAGGVGPSDLPVRPVGGDQAARAGRNGRAGEDVPGTGGLPTGGLPTGGLPTGGLPTGGIGAGTGPVATGPGTNGHVERSFGVERFGDEHEFGIGPFTPPPGEAKAAPNVAVPGQGNGSAPAAWDDDLPTELAARAAAAGAYRPSDPNLPLIGDDSLPDLGDPTPIFDQISVWFATDPSTGSLPVTVTVPDDSSEVIDLREPAQPSSRWASLGDQRWLATNARAAAAPDTAGTTDQGLPKRRPGANLLPSAAAAAPAGSFVRGADSMGIPLEEIPRLTHSADADQVRGRLGSYQRGLANARRARSQDQDAATPAFDSVGAGLFTANRDPGEDAGQHSGDQGGDQ
jgi:signal transduction histidine kinase